ncbi:regenerating islet-derived protein 4-like isoform X1 [Rhinatrema bivittatum]|uniref:regenerating islet-derived protein 4-like isoform X1 n=1 Tax=Rhinatrema bivittatum TaxID=194408 RepID=UPI00112ACDFB|nr:regenerating islet-derived protein 4-like isoform X1 [Rhinatrema bivittatum]XP_029472259.1 regenerating islet-derived protein 4-like isoform X1 [Rhinatrema bivittatum]XP_029472260.1 regenerating islet-derived protein 4-like isoform X1 [Rhinatrema bivittatum]XP_029472261.1 regenerating islet-derived protein 4-like isoform X1 [Rhinatrema bivittatum]
MTPFVCCVSLCLLGTLIFSPSAEGAVVARSRCPSGWFFYKSNCYGYFRFKLSWAEAEFECQSYGHGAHLASILDDAEGNIIASHISAYPKTSDVWLGLHDPEQNRRWKWNDGSMYSFRSWKAGEPNNLNQSEYCGELTIETNYKQWNDAPCDSESFFICKFKP